MEAIKYKSWELSQVSNLYKLKLNNTDEESEHVMLWSQELRDLRDFLNSLELENEGDESIVK